MSLLSDDTIDASLEHISTNAAEFELQDDSDTALVDGVTLDGNNFSGPTDNDGGGGGRKLTCLVEDGDDMSDIDVTTSGDATHGVIKDGSGNVLVEVDVDGAPQAVDNKINLSSFDVIITDPS